MWSDPTPSLHLRVRGAFISIRHLQSLFSFLHLPFILCSSCIHPSVWHVFTLACAFLTEISLSLLSWTLTHSYPSTACTCGSFDLSCIQWCNWMPVIYSTIHSVFTVCQEQKSHLDILYPVYFWKSIIRCIFLSNYILRSHDYKVAGEGLEYCYWTPKPVPSTTGLFG